MEDEGKSYCEKLRADPGRSLGGRGLSKHHFRNENPSDNIEIPISGPPENIRTPRLVGHPQPTELPINHPRWPLC